MKQKTSTFWNELKTDWRKQVFLLLLIIFLPSAIYLIGTGRFVYFFIHAAVVYVLIKLLKKKE